MDIRLKAPYPASALSNLAAHSFVLDGVLCASMEGFLQSLKFADIEAQADVCRQPGPVAQALSRKGSQWKTTQTLWWRGTPYARLSEAYQELLDRAFGALADNSGFREALIATDGEELTHSLGRFDPTETVLTRDEFCLRLYALRARIGHGQIADAPRSRPSTASEQPDSPSGADQPTLRSLSDDERRQRLHNSYVRASELLEFIFSRGRRIESDFNKLSRQVNITLTDREWMDAAMEGGYIAGGRAMLNAVGEYVLDADVLFVDGVAPDEGALVAEGVGGGLPRCPSRPPSAP